MYMIIKNSIKLNIREIYYVIKNEAKKKQLFSWGEISNLKFIQKYLGENQNIKIKPK